MQGNGRVRRILVTPDGTGVVSHAGAFLVSQLSDRLGLSDALSTAMAPTRRRITGHDPGRVLRDLAVMLADGGDCISDLAVLREQSGLFGEVASTATAWRVLDSIDDDGLDRLRAARAAARRTAWAAGGAPARVVLDIDATLVTAHSEKEGATAHYRRGFGFHPLLCFADLDEEGVGGDALAGILRPGRARANDVADHIAVLDLALAQLPEDRRPQPEDPCGPTVLVRADSAGGTYGFAAAVRARGCQFSLGLGLDKPVQQAILKLPASAWAPAIDTDAEPRDGAEVAELTGLLDLSRWPERARAIVRRERPHPGAQLRFTDEDGWRFQVFLTDTGHGIVAHQLAGLDPIGRGSGLEASTGDKTLGHEGMGALDASRCAAGVSARDQGREGLACRNNSVPTRTRPVRVRKGESRPRSLWFPGHGFGSGSRLRDDELTHRRAVPHTLLRCVGMTTALVSAVNDLEIPAEPGVSRHAVRCVLKVYCKIAQTDGSFRYGLRGSKVAALADLSLSTIRRAQRYLVSHGFLEKVQVGGGRASTRWKIVLEKLGIRHASRPAATPKPERENRAQERENRAQEREPKRLGKMFSNWRDRAHDSRRPPPQSETTAPVRTTPDTNPPQAPDPVFDTCEHGGRAGRMSSGLPWCPQCRRQEQTTGS